MPFVDKETIDEAKASLDRLLAAADEEAAKRELASVRRAIAAVESGVPGAARGLETFFESVSRGMIDAQRDLDRRSVEYSGSAAPGALPTAFRIPKANAEFQFGIESSTTRGLNVLILSAEQSQKEMVRHKVSFDVVAVPPPPEVVARIATERPGLAARLRKLADDPETEADESEAAKTLADNIRNALWLSGPEGILVVLLAKNQTFLYAAFLPEVGEATIALLDWPPKGLRAEAKKLVQAVGGAAKAAGAIG